MLDLDRVDTVVDMREDLNLLSFMQQEILTILVSTGFIILEMVIQVLVILII